jgi:hypothetical protein
VRWFLLLSASLVACGKSREEPPRPVEPASPSASGSASASDAPTAPTPEGCTLLPFAETTPVPEASAAPWFTVDGKPMLVVISDSGNDGAYGLVDPETGATSERGTLPLGDAGDDFEGAATRTINGVQQLVTLTSAGWVREYTRTKNGFALVRDAYPLAPKETDWVCGKKKGNCARDFEGLCLSWQASTQVDIDDKWAADLCIGFAASKDDGALYCLTTTDDGTLAVDKRSIAIAKHNRMADCAFADDGRTLYTANNIIGLFDVQRVDNWQDAGAAKVVDLGKMGTGNPEAIAVRGKDFYRMSDSGGAPSYMWHYRCK